MNKVYYWIFFLLLLAGCQDRTDSSYVITGKVVNSLTDGNVVYLSHSNGDELVNLDSAIVDGGVFSFHGVQEEPIMAYLRFNRYLDSLAVPVLFVLENGAMEAVMDTSYSSVAGTEQNNIFEEYKREAYRLDSLRRCLHNHYVEQVEKRMMDAGLEQSMCDEDFRLSSQEERLAYRFIRRNHYSPAAIWVLEQMQSRFDEDELRSLLSGFGGRSKNAQILSDISLRLRNADKVGPGNPYVDVPLIEYSGRKENLSGYIGYARYTAIGFWRSDSEPSCRDMTKFGELYRAYGYRGATFLSVSLDKNRDIWREKVRTLGLLSHQCAAAEPDVIETRYALVSVPDFMLIAPDGSIDSRNLTVAQLEQRLQELLPYRARRDTAVSSVPDATGFVKRSSI